jgi:hypothetical protein
MNIAKSTIARTRLYLCLLIAILASLVATSVPVAAANDQSPGQLKKAENQINATVKGTVSAFSGNSITITPISASAVTLRVDSQTRIILYGVLTIATGQKAESTYNKQTLVAERISVNNPTVIPVPPKVLPNRVIADVKGTISALSGNYVAINPSAGGSIVNVLLDSHTDITLYGVSSMAVGQTINAIYNTQTMIAERIMINMMLPADDDKNPNKRKFAEIHGTISAVSGNHVSINPVAGSNLITLAINAETDIFLNGVSSIAPGQTVNAVYYVATLVAERIMVNVPLPPIKPVVPPVQRSLTVQGTISATSGNYVSINPSAGGNIISLSLTARTDIFLNGVISMATGQKIIAVYNSQTLVAERISINGPMPPPGFDNNSPRANNNDKDKDDRDKDNRNNNDQRFKFNEKMKEMYNWFLRFFNRSDKK